MQNFQSKKAREIECKVCGKVSIYTSAKLGVCADCVRDRFEEARPHIEKAHAEVRDGYNLPPEPPSDVNGVPCGICGNDCQIPEGKVGFCGLVENVKGKLSRKIGTSEQGLVSYYYDPLPTNCVSAWCCAGSSGAGYPEWCHSPEGDIGYDNLAVFLGSCTYSCLYCQNFQFRKMTKRKEPVVGAGELVEKVTDKVRCICYFGGDPSSQMLFVNNSAELATEAAEKKGQLLRVCMETNLSMNRASLERFAELSMESGGGIKVDLKCWSSEILYALSGVKHRKAFENTRYVGSMHRERPEVPFARTSTLLVPDYINEYEIRKLASFIADIDPTIPYSLLGFRPTHYMSDLPLMERSEAAHLLKVCKQEGLEKVRIGNPWLFR